MGNDKKYRPCVVAVIKNNEGQILVGERQDAPGCWQLPQGGVDQGENPEQALLREVYEETGCHVEQVLHQCPGTYQYDFPKNFKANIAKNWAGQVQTWFLCTITGIPDVHKASDKEFSRFSWMNKEDVVAQIIEFKKTVYQQAFGDLDEVLKRQ